MVEADKERLQASIATADQILLFDTIRAAQEEFGKRVDQRSLSTQVEERRRWISIFSVSLWKARSGAQIPRLGVALALTWP